MVLTRPGAPFTFYDPRRPIYTHPRFLPGSRLSDCSVRNVTLGGKLTLITIGEDKPVLGLFDKLQLNLRGDIMLISVLNADSLASNPMGIDKQFIYGNSLIDAVVLQLGLLGNY